MNCPNQLTQNAARLPLGCQEVTKATLGMAFVRVFTRAALPSRTRIGVSVHFRGRMDGFQASLLKTGAELGSNRRGIMEVRRSGRRWLF
ncbi:MAG: hypothetical protein PHN77_19925, partial [Thermoguttaceae bacterium]|nr:hypothetical protein [Thermoguttaceae bacterium]